MIAQSVIKGLVTKVWLGMVGQEAVSALGHEVTLEGVGVTAGTLRGGAAVLEEHSDRHGPGGVTFLSSCLQSPASASRRPVPTRK